MNKNAVIIAAVFVLFPAGFLRSAAAPVRVNLTAVDAVAPLPDGFIALGSIATFNGSDAALIKRLAEVEVGRAPLPGDVRHMNPGDILLKLRQAGIDPQKDVSLEGARLLTITVTSSALAPAVATGPAQSAAGANAVQDPAAADSTIVVHRGDEVILVLQDGGLVITASGVAQEPGAVGQEIRVRRLGVYEDLIGIVEDDHTVALEF